MPIFMIRINEIANLFHFVNNLSEWHFSCRKSYNDAWLAETGELTRSERQALQQFSTIVQHFPFGDQWLGKSFILADSEIDAWRHVSEAVGKDDLSVLHSVFDEMTPRFMRIWKSDMPRMSAVKGKLTDMLQADSVGTVINVLSRFFNAATPPMTVDLLLSRGEGTGGGANEALDHVSLEVLETGDLRHAVDTVLHEVAHNMEEPCFRVLFQEVSSEYGLEQMKGKVGWDAHSLVREAIFHAMFPGGCLSYLVGVPLRDHIMSARRLREDGNLRRAGIDELTGALVPLVRSYFEECKTIDRAFFERACQLYKGLSFDIG